MSKKSSFKIFGHVLTSSLSSSSSSFDLVLSSLLFLKNFNNHGFNGEEEESCYGLRFIHVFVHPYKACCKYTSFFLARRMEEVCYF